jgi:hypothetical protein
MLTAILTYDIPGMMPCDRVVSNTVDGNLQTVVFDLSKMDPWWVSGWVRQLCYALLCVVIGVVGWSVTTTALSAFGVTWYIGQAADAYKAGNLFDDGLWEYTLLASGFIGTLIFILAWNRNK